MRIFISTLFLLILSFVNVSAQESRSPEELFDEVSNYTFNRTQQMSAAGKRASRDDIAGFDNEKTSLAKKYAAIALAKSNPSARDLLYTAFLFETGGNDKKAFELFRSFLSQVAPDATGNGVQIARSRVVVYAGRQKLFDEMEKTYASWASSTPLDPALKVSLERSIATAYFNGENYEQAIKYGRSAFELVRNLEAKTWRERGQKTDMYADLTEVMILSYKKTDRKDEAVDMLAQARAASFTIPSSTLYTKVMDMGSKYGISEKKLMQKVESYPNADPAPEFAAKEWIGQEPATLESLRGKVVLLDFWATWCGPCISTFPRLRNWHKKYGPQGFTILGITQLYGQANGKTLKFEEEMEFLKEFKGNHKLPYGFAVTSGPDTSSKYGIKGIPATFLLDRHGVVRYIGVGASVEEAENLEEMIKKVLAEQ